MSGPTPGSQRESPFHIHLPAGRYSKTSSGVAPEQQVHGHHSASQGRRPIHDEAASHADMESPHEEQEKLLSDFDIDHDNAAAYQNATTPRSHPVSRSPLLRFLYSGDSTSFLLRLHSLFPTFFLCWASWPSTRPIVIIHWPGAQCHSFCPTPNVDS